MTLKAKEGGRGQDEKVGALSPCTSGWGQSQQNGGVPKDSMTPLSQEHTPSPWGGAHWSHSSQTFAEAMVL